MLWNFRIDLIARCNQIPIEKATVNQEGPSPLLKPEAGDRSQTHRATCPCTQCQRSPTQSEWTASPHWLLFPSNSLNLSVREASETSGNHSQPTECQQPAGGRTIKGRVIPPHLSFKDGHCHCSYNSVLEEMPVYWAVAKWQPIECEHARGYWQSFFFNVFYWVPTPKYVKCILISKSLSLLNPEGQEVLLAILTILFFSWVPDPGARSLCAGTGVLGCDQPVGLRLLGLLDRAEGEA